MAECELRFSPSSQSDTGAFKLMELPPDLCKLIESSANSADRPKFTIKGVPEEDAVLCTADKTYTVRSVVLSNSVLVVTPDPTTPGEDEDAGDSEDPVQEVFIRDQLHEVVELVPCVPRLHKLSGLLRGREYDEGHDDEDVISHDEDDDGVLPKRQKLTLEDARGMIQASDAELDKGLRDRRVLILDGALRPIAPSHLTTILELLLTNLVSHSLSHDAAPAVTLVSALEEEHDIRRDVVRQVMEWFGQIGEDDTWAMDVNAVIKEVGLGILRTYGDDPTPHDAFLDQWKRAVGDTFEDKVALPLLAGNFLTSLDTLADPPVPLLTYFPASALPVDPGARFAALFLARPRWTGDGLAPFLADIAVDGKERDKLLLKHARALTEAGGIWYTARAKYNG